jgi:hypothetical protein
MYIYIYIYVYIYIYIYIYTYIYILQIDIGFENEWTERDTQQQISGPESFRFVFSWVDCFGYLLLNCSVKSIPYIICMFTLLLMPLAGLNFCVGLDFVTPSLNFL